MFNEKRATEGKELISITQVFEVCNTCGGQTDEPCPAHDAEDSQTPTKIAGAPEPAKIDTSSVVTSLWGTKIVKRDETKFTKTVHMALTTFGVWFAMVGSTLYRNSGESDYQRNLGKYFLTLAFSMIFYLKSGDLSEHFKLGKNVKKCKSFEEFYP